MMRRKVLITNDRVPRRINHTWRYIEREEFARANTDIGVRVNKTTWTATLIMLTLYAVSMFMVATFA